MPLVISTSDVNPSRTCNLAAEQAYAELAEVVDWLDVQPDEPDLRVHCLFARLYHYDTKYWLEKLDQDEDAEFLKLFIARFMDAYFKQVIDVLKQQEGTEIGNWDVYFRRTEKLTMRSNIFSHLLIVVTAFNTHITRDIPEILDQTSKDYENLFGRPIDLERNRILFFDLANRDVFLNALLEFIAFHRTHQSVFRRKTLGFFVKLLGRTSKIWWPVLNGWRASSWARFEQQIKNE